MKMQQFAINLTSENPERMNAFYRNTIGLEPEPTMGDHAYKMAGAVLFLDGHSDTRGPAKEPQRALLDWFVDDAKAERERLEAKGVQFIRKEGREYWGGIISTFVDPDGNYVQLIQFDAEAAQQAS
jgi:predicted enzyme related to lactoylglutathione lyase